jgi:DNA-binding transcriptional MerR regulator
LFRQLTFTSTARERVVRSAPVPRLAPRAAAAPARRRTDPRAFVAAHHADDAGDIVGIADLAREFAISPRALRFYESKGLLHPRRAGRARVYTRRDRARLTLILRAQALGSTLAEIRHYLDLYGDHGEGRMAQLEYVVARTAQAIGALETKRRQLDTTLAELRVIHATCVKQLADRRRKA